MKKRNIIIGLLLLVVLVSVGLFYVQNNKSTEGFISDPIGQALRKHMIPISTVEAGNGFEDLNKLKPYIKDKKIIAMGEATHGTKEFFQMKHRMFEFLVEEMGYRVFAMEAGFNSTFIVNDYILNGKGSAQKAVDSLLYPVWNTQEILEMIEWMKKYNDNPNHKEKIKFYGFDIQDGYIEAKNLENYLLKVDKELYLRYAESLKAVNNDILKMTYMQINELIVSINKLKEAFVSNRNNYISKSISSEYELVNRQINVILQYIDYIANDTSYKSGKASTLRDYYMAENIKWIIDYESQQDNDKIMLWAHNAHVGYKYPDFTTMGKNLKDYYGNSYYSIGLDFFKGNFKAIPMDNYGKFLSSNFANFYIEGSDDFMLTAKIKAAKLPLGFIDFNTAAKDNKLNEIFYQTQLFHNIGLAYNGVKMYETISCFPIDFFDGLIYIENTTAAKGILRYQTVIEDGNVLLQENNANK